MRPHGSVGEQIENNMICLVSLENVKQKKTKPNSLSGLSWHKIKEAQVLDNMKLCHVSVNNELMFT